MHVSDITTGKISIHHLDIIITCPCHVHESSVTNYVKDNPLNGELLPLDNNLKGYLDSKAGGTRRLLLQQRHAGLEFVNLQNNDGLDQTDG